MTTIYYDNNGNGSNKATNPNATTDLTPKEALDKIEWVKFDQGNGMYFYETLFKNQEDSDVSIQALGKVWNLHKLILKQSPYFAGMFSGSWREMTEKCIPIDFSSDPNISLDSLEAVFSTLYHGEINIGARNVIPVLATATFFQLQQIINKCEDIMKKTVNCKTAVSYYKAAQLYGLQSVKLAAKEWLEINLLAQEEKSIARLKEISLDVMIEIISSPDLIVFYEGDIYELLRKWLFIQMQQLSAAGEKDLEITDYEINKFFRSYTRCQSNTASVAASVISIGEGAKYKQVFDMIRLKHLLFRGSRIDCIRSDNIIPLEVVNSALSGMWYSYSTLKNELLDIQIGPSSKSITSKYFEESCRRYGFRADENVIYKMGLAFLFESVHASLTLIGRNIFWVVSEVDDSRIRLSNRRIMMKVCLTSVNKQGQPLYRQTSDLLTISLKTGEQIHILNMDDILCFPMFVSLKLLDMEPTVLK